MNIRRSLSLCLFSAALLWTPAAASQVRPVNLEEMTGRAARVFSGRCVETSVALDPALGREVRLATFEVERMVKGEPGARVTVRTLGGSGSSAGFGADFPRFRPGDEVVLFLYGESALGLTSPVGLGQGRFRIVTDKQGRRIALNDFANQNLLRGLTSAARGRLGTSFEAWKERRDLDPAALLDMAEALATSSSAAPSGVESRP